MNEKPQLPPLFWKDAHQNAPSFVKGQISVNVPQMIKYFETYKEFISDKGWMTLGMKEARTGNIYFDLDTWKPAPKYESQQPDGTTYPQDDNGAVAVIEAGTHPLPTSDDKFADLVDESQIPF